MFQVALPAAVGLEPDKAGGGYQGHHHLYTGDSQGYYQHQHLQQQQQQQWLGDYHHHHQHQQQYHQQQQQQYQYGQQYPGPHYYSYGHPADDTVYNMAPHLSR